MSVFTLGLTLGEVKEMAAAVEAAGPLSLRRRSDRCHKPTAFQTRSAQGQPESATHPAASEQEMVAPDPRLPALAGSAGTAAVRAAPPQAQASGAEPVRAAPPQALSAAEPVLPLPVLSVTSSCGFGAALEPPAYPAAQTR